MALTLLQRVASNDASAITGVLDQYGGLVWSLARRFSPTDADAEDATQEIFTEIWKSAGRYDPSVASEATFIATIARRRLIDRTRKSSRRLDNQPLPEVGGGQMDPQPDRVDLTEEAAFAAEALQMLSQEQQRVLRLSICHGLSHERISEATGLPLGTVKTHARRGLIRIREIIEQRKKKGPSLESVT